MLGTLFRNIFGGKKWYQSLTAWGLVVFTAGYAGVAVMCGGDSSLLSGETCAQVQHYLELAGGVMTTLGIRKAQNPSS